MANNAHASKHSILANLTVARRIYLLLGLALLALIVIGVAGLLALNADYRAINNVGGRLNALYAGESTLHTLQREVMLTLYEVNIGSRTYEDGITRLELAEQRLKQELIPLYSDTSRQENRQLTPQTRQTITAMNDILKLIQNTRELLSTRDTTRLQNYLKNDLTNQTSALASTINASVDKDFASTREAITTATTEASRFVKRSGLAIVTVLITTILLGYWIYHSIALSIGRLRHTIRQIESGDLSARSELEGKDELAELGYNLDRMMDERLATQARIDRDHHQLNESVFGLLQAVADLSDRNLTVRAKVTEDATGPLADAINQLAEDTTDVLKRVREIALSVEHAAADVNQHALSVNKLAQLEQTEAQETQYQLDQVLSRFSTIATSAQQANQVAITTGDVTTKAQLTVDRTLDNMQAIREGVKETSKRLKRLGERSQEISNITSIIDNIAERTTVLALNASMQATAAGEAGRGFSLIAEEIQRLAENSRDSTEQISTLVHNIQQEANVTISTMERAIEQVITGSDLAEETSEQMQATLEATHALIASVEQIASSSADQVALSRAIQVRAERILEATQTTGRELSSLTTLTKNMTDYSRRLVSSVNVFKLEA